MIVHVFNSSLVSGPETLVIPALPMLDEKVVVIFLSETRLGELSKRPPVYSRSFGLETLEIPVRARWDKASVLELRSTLEKLSPRIVHAHELKASAYLAQAALKHRRYKIVTTNHGVRGKKALKMRFYEWFFEHRVMPKFDRILTVCTSDRTLLIQRGVQGDKIFVHLNGVDRPEISFERRRTESSRIRDAWNLKKLGVPDEAVCLGIVARLAKEKRHSLVLKTFRALMDLKPKQDVHLIVFGTGPLQAALIEESHRLGLSKNVHWMGYRGTVGSEAAGFDLLLSLSATEGLPINVIEAGWAGTPVVATAVDGNLDLIPSEEFGLLFETQATPLAISQRLCQLISDPERLHGMGENFRARVKAEFSGEIWLKRLKELYEFQ